MLVWLTLPFYDFCGFRSVAINSVYKLQFFTFMFLYKLFSVPLVVIDLIIITGPSTHGVGASTVLLTGVLSSSSSVVVCRL